jgi:hypothetical protein
MLSWGFLVARWLGYGCFKVNSDFQCKYKMTLIRVRTALNFDEQGASLSVSKLFLDSLLPPVFGSFRRVLDGLLNKTDMMKHVQC